MKKLAIAVLTMAMVTMFSAKGFTGERELHGMMIGAGGGALIGSAIGGSAEAAIIGSAIGGAVGVVASSGHHHGLPFFPPVFIVPPPFNHYPKYSHRPHNYHRRDYYRGGHGYRGKSYYRGKYDRHRRDDRRGNHGRTDKPRRNSYR